MGPSRAPCEVDRASATIDASIRVATDIPEETDAAARTKASDPASPWMIAMSAEESTIIGESGRLHAASGTAVAGRSCRLACTISTSEGAAPSLSTDSCGCSERCRTVVLRSEVRSFDGRGSPWNGEGS